MSKYNDMKSYDSDKMFHNIETMPSYNGCTLSITIGYQNRVIIYETSFKSRGQQCPLSP